VNQVEQSVETSRKWKQNEKIYCKIVDLVNPCISVDCLGRKNPMLPQEMITLQQVSENGKEGKGGG